MGVNNCSMFCCTLLCVRSSIVIILMGKRELIALLNLSSWCLVMVEGLFLSVPQNCLLFVIVVFPDHTHYFCCSLLIWWSIFFRYEIHGKCIMVPVHFSSAWSEHQVSYATPYIMSKPHMSYATPYIMSEPHVS